MRASARPRDGGVAPPLAGLDPDGILGAKRPSGPRPGGRGVQGIRGVVKVIGGEG